MVFNNNGNNSWLYNKAYYNGFDWDRNSDENYAPTFFNERLEWLKNVRLNVPQYPGQTNEIRLNTTYPGLATGIGVKHETKSTGELKLGFEFDYSSGMPVIRGHSVKGVLRAAFPQDHRKGVKFKKEKAYQVYCWLNDLIFTHDGLQKFNADPEKYKLIKAYESEIFDGRLFNGSLISVYDQDVFFDSFVTIASRYPSTLNQYLANDSITPHKKKRMSYEKSMLKNPVPIPFLKILPGVTITFKFMLHNNGLLNIVQKQKLFTAILTDKGVGAKTNVGYGQFKSV